MNGRIIEDEQRERLARLAAFGPRLMQEGIGRWPAAEKQSVNTPTDLPRLEMMPNFAYTPAADTFHRYCYEDGWIIESFDWPAWAKQRPGSKHLKNPALVASADAETLSRLLTVILRSDRFTEGAIAGFWSLGIIPAILNRAAELSKSE